MKNMNEKNMKCFKIVSWTLLQTFFFSYTRVKFMWALPQFLQLVLWLMSVAS